jgi:hypothetical protein
VTEFDQATVGDNPRFEYQDAKHMAGVVVDTALDRIGGVRDESDADKVHVDAHSILADVEALLENLPDQPDKTSWPQKYKAVDLVRRLDLCLYRNGNRNHARTDLPEEFRMDLIHAKSQIGSRVFGISHE